MHRACNALKRFPRALAVSKRISLPPRLPLPLARSHLYPHYHGKTILSIRTYSNDSPKTDGEQIGENQTDESVSDKITSEMWLQVLEQASRAPWLNMHPANPDDRLRQAHALLLQIVLYLGRPQPDPDMAQHYLLAFETAPVGPGTEIARARDAIAIITRAVVNSLSTIPMNAEFRTKHVAIFDVLGALVALNDTYLMGEGGKVGNWGDFWSRAQPVVLDLLERLENEGFGLSDAEQEELSRKP